VSLDHSGLDAIFCGLSLNQRVMPAGLHVDRYLIRIIRRAGWHCGVGDAAVCRCGGRQSENLGGFNEAWRKASAAISSVVSVLPSTRTKATTAAEAIYRNLESSSSR